MMRILLISNMYPTQANPAYGIFVKNIEMGLIAQGAIVFKRVTVSVREFSFIIKFWAYLLYFFRILFFGLSKKYDFIYVHFVLHNAIPLIILKILKPSIKICANIHGSDLKHNTFINIKLRRFIKPFLRRTDYIIIPSKYFKTELQKTYRVPNNKILISPSGGVADFFFQPSSIDKSPIFTIGYLSKIINIKGWEIFLKALVLLKNQNIQYKALVGGHPQGNSLGLIKQYMLEDYIDYIGVVPYSNLPDYYSKLDVFIFPTLMEESLGLVGIEAMSKGIPVISSKIGGISDYLIDQYNGFWFQPGDSLQLYEKIMHYYQLDNNTKLLMQNNSCNTALNYKYSSVIENLYENLEKQFL